MKGIFYRKYFLKDSWILKKSLARSLLVASFLVAVFLYESKVNNTLRKETLKTFISLSFCGLMERLQN